MDRVHTALPCLLQQKGNPEKTVFFAPFTVADSLIIIWSGGLHIIHTASMYFVCALGLCSGSGKRVGQNLYSLQVHLLACSHPMVDVYFPKSWRLVSQNVAPFKRPSAEALLQTSCIINGPPVTFVTRAWNRLARIHPETETVETNGGISWYEGVSKWKWHEDNDKWLRTLIMDRQQKRIAKPHSPSTHIRQESNIISSLHAERFQHLDLSLYVCVFLDRLLYCYQRCLCPVSHPKWGSGSPFLIPKFWSFWVLICISYIFI